MCCRLRLQPAVPSLQRALPSLHTPAAVIELSPAQSGNIGTTAKQPQIQQASAHVAIPPAAANHVAGNDDLQQSVNPHASQHTRKRQRQLIDSSSEDEPEATPNKHAAPSAMHAQSAAENRPYQQQAADADFEDYGNEPHMDEDLEGPMDLCEDADAGNAEQNQPGFEPRQPAAGQHQQHRAFHHAASAATPHRTPAGSSGLAAQQEAGTTPAADAPVDLTEQTPEQTHPAATVANAILEEKQLQAIDALHRLPFTTLQDIAEHAANLPASDFPKTLRLNAKLARVLSKLQYKDEHNRPLDQYSIDVELQDETDKCQAAIGHQVLLPIIGELSSIDACLPVGHCVKRRQVLHERYCCKAGWHLYLQIRCCFAKRYTNSTLWGRYVLLWLASS